MLNVRGIEISYGKVRAVQGVDLSVNQGEIVSLIGLNGAGKSSLLRAIAGLNRVRHRDGAGGPLDLQAHDGPREPDPGRLHAQGHVGIQR
jgi:ABC-type branched-subunit amino acid transport system ATPase component